MTPDGRTRLLPASRQLLIGMFLAAMVSGILSAVTVYIVTHADIKRGTEQRTIACVRANRSDLLLSNLLREGIKGSRYKDVKQFYTKAEYIHIYGVQAKGINDLAPKLCPAGDKDKPGFKYVNTVPPEFRSETGGK